MGKDDKIAKEMEKTRNYTLENQQFTPKSWRWMGDSIFPFQMGDFLSSMRFIFQGVYVNVHPVLGCLGVILSTFEAMGSRSWNLIWRFHWDPGIQTGTQHHKECMWCFNLSIEYIQVSVAKYIKIYLYKLNTNHNNNPITVLIPYFRRNHLYPKKN